MQVDAATAPSVPLDVPGAQVPEHTELFKPIEEPQVPEGHGEHATAANVSLYFPMGHAMGLALVAPTGQ